MAGGVRTSVLAGIQSSLQTLKEEVPEWNSVSISTTASR